MIMVAMVSHFCAVMMASKPRMPSPTTTTATTTTVTILAAFPDPGASRSATVPVASTAIEERKISQPINSR